MYGVARDDGAARCTACVRALCARAREGECAFMALRVVRRLVYAARRMLHIASCMLHVARCVPVGVRFMRSPRGPRKGNGQSFANASTQNKRTRRGRAASRRTAGGAGWTATARGASTCTTAAGRPSRHAGLVRRQISPYSPRGRQRAVPALNTGMGCQDRSSGARNIRHANVRRATQDMQHTTCKRTTCNARHATYDMQAYDVQRKTCNI